MTTDRYMLKGDYGILFPFIFAYFVIYLHFPFPVYLI